MGRPAEAAGEGRPVARRIVEEVLADVEAGRGTARDLLDAALQGRDLDPRDRDLAREIAYGTLRRLVTIDHVLSHRSKLRLRNLEPRVRSALRAGAYQLLFLDRVPASAAVHEAVGGARQAGGPRARTRAARSPRETAATRASPAPSSRTPPRTRRDRSRCAGRCRGGS
jgi:16S rRNA (cytosine967-C5)-methyltransferase